MFLYAGFDKNFTTKFKVQKIQIKALKYKILMYNIDLEISNNCRTFHFNISHSLLKDFMEHKIKKISLYVVQIFTGSLL